MAGLQAWLAGQLGRSQTAASADAESLQVAVAALLLEVLRADFEAAAVERTRVLQSLRGVLGLEEAEAQRLLERAERQTDQVHDLYQFTSLLNHAHSAAEKERLVEELWRVARADKVIDKYEEHLICRIADLPHVPHSAFIAAKLRTGG